MFHTLHRVKRFSVIGPYALNVEFSDGTEQSIDFQPVLRGAMYGPLRDPTLFKAVTLDGEVGTLTWPNGADFDAATLHDWPEVSAELAERAKGWE